MGLIFATAQRLPAPVQEITETPTPELPKPKAKRSNETTDVAKKPSNERRLASPSKTNPSAIVAPFDIPHSRMSATASNAHPGAEAKNAIDGDPQTMWHTAWGLMGPEVSLPQSITLSLGGTYTVNKLRYLPRQDSGFGSLNGNILAYKIYVSVDGNAFRQVASGNWSDDHTEKVALFAPHRAGYVRLEAVKTHGGHASAAELNVGAIP